MLFSLIAVNLLFWGILFFTDQNRWLISLFAHLLYAIYKVLNAPKTEINTLGLSAIPIIAIIIGVLGMFLFGGPLGSVALILGIYSARNDMKYGIGGVVLGTIGLGWSVLLMLQAVVAENEE